MSEKFPWPPPPGGGRFLPGTRVRIRASAVESNFDDIEAKVHNHFAHGASGTVEPEIDWSHLQAVVRFESCGESHGIHVDALERI